ncbi:Phosphatidylinositol 4-kinase beta [Perkinsus olseni]|uniref:1-phosphatidylinositol 4-kinase n=1 Tax=Perkinsus olseni TaxID=32597 RepID=A0A7J6T0I2_PEROL|nr:Phosphatidylinositol 4-kinase beta [Perkinsus olseni]
MSSSSSSSSSLSVGDGKKVEAGEEGSKPDGGDASLGSLLRLFKSEVFDAYYHMHYLHTMTSQGVNDYLVNELYNVNDKYIDFYLPQLVYSSLKRINTSSLHTFLLDKAAQRMGFALKLHWLYQAVIEDGAKVTGTEMHEAALRLCQECEMAVVNCGLAPSVATARKKQSNAALTKGDSRLQKHQFKQHKKSSTSTSQVMARAGGIAGDSIHDGKKGSSVSLPPPEYHQHTPEGSVGVAESVASVPPMVGRTRNSNQVRDGGGEGISRSNSNPELSAVPSQPMDDDATEGPSVVGSDDDATSPTSSVDAHHDDDTRRDSATKEVVSLQESLEALRNASRSARGQASPYLNRISTMSIYAELGDPETSIDRYIAVSGITLPAASNAVTTDSRGCTMGAGGNESDEDIKHLDGEMEKFLLKQLRCDYFNNQNTFVAALCRLSCLLVNHSERKQCLAAAMSQLNEWLFERRAAVAMTTGSFQLTGLSLPQGMPACNNRKDSVQTHILSVHTEDCRVFKTRTRAPYMLTLEVADLDEIFERAEPRPKTSRDRCNEVSKYVLEEMKMSRKKFEDSRYPYRDELRYAVAHTPVTEWCNNFYGPIIRESMKTFQVGTIVDPFDTGMADPTVCVTALEASALSTHKADGVTEVPPEKSEEQQQKATPHQKRKQKRQEEAEKVRQSIWGELFREKKSRIRKGSVYGQLDSWNVVQVMVKGGDDVRQEVLAGQLVRVLQSIFDEARLPLWLKPYETIVVDANSGLMEMLTDTISIDALKKQFPDKSLDDIFRMAFSDSRDTLDRARNNFIESLAAYSLFSYFLAVRDRHNGNLLLDRDGHLIHIDFGYMLSNAPGNFAFETAPFKLTQEYIDVIGGEDSDKFEYFRTLVIRGFLEARKHRDRLILLVRMLAESGCKMDCLTAGGAQNTIKQMDDRFFGHLTEEACIEKIVVLIDNSVNNWRTIQYDNFQRITNGIL